jgi:hypothetical protein
MMRCQNISSGKLRVRGFRDHLAVHGMLIGGGDSGGKSSRDRMHNETAELQRTVCPFKVGASETD